MESQQSYPKVVNNLVILLVGCLVTFLFASQITNLADFIPDIELTGIPLIFAPITIAVAVIFKNYFIKSHSLLFYFVLLPFSVLFLGYFLFAFALRNLR